MEVQRYGAPNSHVYHSPTPYFANNYSDSIYDVGQSAIFQTDIRHLPKDLGTSKVVDILLDPVEQKWERVNKDDIFPLQKRGIKTKHLKYLIKNHVSIRRAARIAEKIPEMRGGTLAKEIVKISKYKSSGGIFSYLSKLLNFLWQKITWLLGTKKPIRPPEEPYTSNNQASLNKTAEVEEESEPMFIAENHESNFKLLSIEDFRFLQERGLTRDHLRELSNRQISAQEAIAGSRMFLHLERDELSRKILEATEQLESSALRYWNPFMYCSGEGLKDRAHKALILMSKAYFSRTNTPSAWEVERQHWLRLLPIYNICLYVFSDEMEFKDAIAKHENIQFLLVKAQGNDRTIYLADKAFFKFPSNVTDRDYSSLFKKHFNPKAHIGIQTSYSGKGREQKANWANFFYLNLPPGVKVFAATQDVFTNHMALTKDAEGFIEAKFWGYNDDSKRGKSPLFENIRDITYTVSSTTKLPPNFGEYKVWEIVKNISLIGGVILVLGVVGCDVKEFWQGKLLRNQ